VSETREKLASRIGFILLSAGCAIGLGNVWRFPYIAGQNGGGWFVAIYLVFLAILGLPVLMMEFAIGRAAQRSIARAHEALTPEKPAWRLHGVAGVLGCVILMMFYTVVTGWMLVYFWRMATGAFADAAPAAIGAAFGGMLGSPVLQVLTATGVCVTCFAICAIGLQKGLERVAKVMMIFLLLLICVLAVRSVMLPDAGKGVEFYLVPDFARMCKVGVGKVIVEAMNHAFFTLSIGIGSMLIFGSYIGRHHTLLKESLNICVLDTAVALTAGLVIIPACFAFGIDQTQGPGLIFVTLPNVFVQMAGGRFWGALFFLFMSCAALTTVLAVFECILAGVCEYTGWSRRKTCVVLAFVLPLLSLPCVFGFNIWRGFEPMGKGTCVLDLEDFAVSNVLLPLGGLAFALYCAHRFGWGWEKCMEEINAGEGVRLPGGKAGKVLRLYVAYGLPLVIAAVFSIGLYDKFFK